MGTTLTPDKTGEAIRLIKFDGDENKWPEWSVKVLAFAKSKEFKEGLTGNQAKAFSDATVLTTEDDDVKEAYKLNDRAYQFLILSCSDIAFGLVNMAKTEELKDGDARIAWKNLLDRYAPQGSTDLIHLTGEFNNCVLDNSRSDPDLWFIKIEDIRRRLASIDAKYSKEDY
jgi:hypothetical protein